MSFSYSNHTGRSQKLDLPKRKRKTARFAGSVGRFSRVTRPPQPDTDVHSKPKSFLMQLASLDLKVCPALPFCTLSATNKWKKMCSCMGYWLIPKSQPQQPKVSAYLGSPTHLYQKHPCGTAPAPGSANAPEPLSDYSPLTTNRKSLSPQNSRL